MAGVRDSWLSRAIMPKEYWSIGVASFAIVAYGYDG